MEAEEEVEAEEGLEAEEGVEAEEEAAMTTSGWRRRGRPRIPAIPAAFM